MVDRRGLLAGAAAFALSGCGRSASEDSPGGAPPERSATSRKGDIELLRAALGIEEQQASPIDREHAARLRQALSDFRAEATPTAAEGAPDAAGAEGRAIAFYLDMLPKVYDAKLRSVIASILVVESQQLAVLRDRDGENPAPDAFVYGFPPS